MAGLTCILIALLVLCSAWVSPPSPSGDIVAPDISVPDIEALQLQLFKGLDKLESMGAYLEGEDGDFLGKLSKNRFDSDSLANTFGDHGSKYSSKSIFNTYGDYGSKYSSKSAYSKYAIDPPKILIEQSGKAYIVGYLTMNKSLVRTGQKISPKLIEFWIEKQD